MIWLIQIFNCKMLIFQVKISTWSTHQTSFIMWIHHQIKGWFSIDIKTIISINNRIISLWADVTSSWVRIFRWRLSQGTHYGLHSWHLESGNLKWLNRQNKLDKIIEFFDNLNIPSYLLINKLKQNKVKY